VYHSWLWGTLLGVGSTSLAMYVISTKQTNFYARLSCYPSGHPENANVLLARSINLVSQYNHTGLLADLNEAIEIAQVAMSTLPS
jgi:LPS O-antigen subunit length determinant protein (WzzB/FepE family)